MYILKNTVDGTWEELWEDDTLLAQGHRLDAEDIFYALGIPVKMEDIVGED